MYALSAFLQHAVCFIIMVSSQPLVPTRPILHSNEGGPLPRHAVYLSMAASPVSLPPKVSVRKSCKGRWLSQGIAQRLRGGYDWRPGPYKKLRKYRVPYVKPPKTNREFRKYLEDWSKEEESGGEAERAADILDQISSSEEAEKPAAVSASSDETESTDLDDLFGKGDEKEKDSDVEDMSDNAHELDPLRSAEDMTSKPKSGRRVGVVNSAKVNDLGVERTPARKMAKRETSRAKDVQSSEPTDPNKKGEMVDEEEEEEEEDSSAA